MRPSAVGAEPGPLSADTLGRMRGQGASVAALDPAADPPAVGRSEAMRIAAREFAMIGAKPAVEAAFGRDVDGGTGAVHRAETLAPEGADGP